MRKILILAVAASFSMACGDDSPKKSANNVNNVSSNNTAMNNAATNNAAANNGASNNVATNNTATNNTTDIQDSKLVRDITDAQEESLLDEFDGYRSTDDIKVICLVQGFFAASTAIANDEVLQVICASAQTDCVTATRDSSVGIYRAETCEGTVGELRACERSKVEQISEYASEFIECTELSESLLADMIAIVEDIPQTDACIQYDNVCP